MQKNNEKGVNLAIDNIVTQFPEKKKRYQDKYILNPVTGEYEFAKIDDKKRVKPKQIAAKNNDDDDDVNLDDLYFEEQTYSQKQSVVAEEIKSGRIKNRYNVDASFAKNSKKFGSLSANISNIIGQFDESPEKKKRE